MITPRSRVAFALLPLVAACVPQPKVAPPAVVAPPRPAPVAPPPPADWRDRPLAAGDWSYDGRVARFGTALTLACDRPAGTVRLGWAGVAAGPVTVRTTYGDIARQGAAAPAGIIIAIAARDPLLDQIAFTRGRWALLAGGREVIVPVQPEIARVVEDCR